MDEIDMTDEAAILAGGLTDIGMGIERGLTAIADVLEKFLDRLADEASN